MGMYGSFTSFMNDPIVGTVVNTGGVAVNTTGQAAGTHLNLMFNLKLHMIKCSLTKNWCSKKFSQEGLDIEITT